MNGRGGKPLSHHGVNVGSAAEERHEAVDTERDAGSGSDFGQQRKELLVDRIVALAAANPEFAS